MPLIFLVTLSVLFTSTLSCVQCHSYYCASGCGLTNYCSGGSPPLRSPCCLPDRPPIASSSLVEQSSCALIGQQLFNYSSSTRQFSVITKSGSRLCLEVYWGDYCNLAPTPLVFFGCDPSRTNQQWVQLGSQIFSGHLDDGARTFGMSSSQNMYYSQASVELARESNSFQQWSFNWTSSFGNLRNSATGSCLQLPAAAFYGTVALQAIPNDLGTIRKATIN
jgi:hypothetical protein